jgi:hypothetical protein
VGSLTNQRLPFLKALILAIREILHVQKLPKNTFSSNETGKSLCSGD